MAVTYYYNLLNSVKEDLEDNISGLPDVVLRKKPVRFKSDDLPLVIVSPTEDNVNDETFKGDDSPTDDSPPVAGRLLIMEYGVQITILEACNADFDLALDNPGSLGWRQDIRQRMYRDMAADPLVGADTIFDCIEMGLGDLFDDSAMDNNYTKSVLRFTFLSKEPANG